MGQAEEPVRAKEMEPHGRLLKFEYKREQSTGQKLEGSWSYLREVFVLGWDIVEHVCVLEAVIQ